MKWSFTLGFTLSLLFFASALQSQNTCEYTLELFDSFGDGWNGAALTVSINGTPTVYTLDDVNDNGFNNIFTLDITDGDEVMLSYQSGVFEFEVTYNLVNPIGVTIFTDGPQPTVGDVFNQVLGCSCFSLDPTSVVVDNVRAFRADLSWMTNFENDSYLLEYDTTGFTPGTGNNFDDATSGETTLFNLEQKTTYDVYIYVACENGDTSNAVGPYTFETLWAIDVGVSDVLMPVTDCGLTTMDTVTVVLQNYGGLPQSLIPFNFSINGIPGGVPQPIDGFFTGVLGTDSTFTIEFETFANLSDFGEYEILAWTELEGDSDMTNDTFSLTITNIPIVAEYPYFIDFEEWNGGWTVEQAGFANASWGFGQPSASIINSAASGTAAWVTNLVGSYNNSELSYLISPCLDLSGLSEDPFISFSLNLNTEFDFDGLWLELSIDGGDSWNKVGTLGSGINWYNQDDFTQGVWWSGDNIFSGWVVAQHLLEGAAGAEDARLRFAFSTDGSVLREGVGIDNVYIFEPVQNDLAAASANHSSPDICGAEFDEITINIFNHGNTTQTGFDVSYQINGGAIITENVGALEVAPGEEVTYTFAQTFNSLGLTTFEVVTSIDAGDDFPGNDATSFFFSPLRSLPVQEDFENAAVPAGWTSDEFLFVTFPGGHNNPTFIISDNLADFDPVFELTTLPIGPIEAGTIVSFDYRYVDFFAGTDATVLGGNDRLELQVAPFCSDIFTTVLTIDSTNHDPSVDLKKVSVSLDDFVGEGVLIRWLATWGQGDYWVDLDNINILTCPSNLGLNIDITAQTDPNLENGAVSIVPTGGEGPYTFEWNTGSTSGTLTGLAAGDYEVTVTDFRGCSEETIINVDIDIVSSNEVEIISHINLFPNPTSGLSQLQVTFKESTNASIQLLNMMGQQLFETNTKDVTSANYDIDLRHQPNGVYLIRIVAGGEVYTTKLIRGK